MIVDLSDAPSMMPFLLPSENHKHTLSGCLTAALGAVVEKLGRATVILANVSVAIRVLRVCVILVTAHNRGLTVATRVRRSVTGVSFAAHDVKMVRMQSNDDRSKYKVKNARTCEKARKIVFMRRI